MDGFYRCIGLGVGGTATKPQRTYPSPKGLLMSLCWQCKFKEKDWNNKRQQVFSLEVTISWSAWVQFSALASDSVFFVVYTPWDSSDGCSNWVPDLHVGDQNWVPISWVQPKPLQTLKSEPADRSSMYLSTYVPITCRLPVCLCLFTSQMQRERRVHIHFTLCTTVESNVWGFWWPFIIHLP